jgi:hypothetical protein
MPDPIIPSYNAGPAPARRFAYIDEEDSEAGTITIIEGLCLIDRAPDDGIIENPWPGTEGITDPIIDIRTPLPSIYKVIPAGQELLKVAGEGWLVWEAQQDMHLLDSQIEAFPLPNQDYKGILYRRYLKYGQTLPEMEDVLGDALYEAIQDQAETLQKFDEEFDAGAGSSLIALLNQFIDLMGANVGDSIVYEWYSTTHIKVLAGGQCRSMDGQKTYKIEEDMILEIGYDLNMEIYEHVADELLEVWIYTDATNGLTAVHALYPPVYLGDTHHPAQLREFLLTDSSGDLIPFSAPLLADVPPGFGCDFYGSIAPLGWHFLDGSQLDGEKFPILAEALGGSPIQIESFDGMYITATANGIPDQSFVTWSCAAGGTPAFDLGEIYTFRKKDIESPPYKSDDIFSLAIGGYPLDPDPGWSGDQFVREYGVFLPSVADKIIKLG